MLVLDTSILRPASDPRIRPGKTVQAHGATSPHVTRHLMRGPASHALLRFQAGCRVKPGMTVNGHGATPPHVTPHLMRGPASHAISRFRAGCRVTPGKTYCFPTISHQPDQRTQRGRRSAVVPAVAIAPARMTALQSSGPVTASGVRASAGSRSAAPGAAGC